MIKKNELINTINDLNKKISDLSKIKNELKKENDILKVELFNLQNQSFEDKFNYYIDERIKFFIKNNLYLKEDNNGDYKNISLCLDNCDTNLGDFTLEK